MNKLLILSTASDMSAKRIAHEAKSMFAQVAHLDYQQVLQDSLPLPKLPFSGADVALLPRQPYSANRIEENYVGLLDIIVKKHQFGTVFDGRLYENDFVLYEDKFYQSYVFDTLGVPYAPLFAPKAITNSLFPIIAKKRLSSRAYSNYILKSSEELEDFMYTQDCTHFIFQKYYPLVADYRLLVLKGESLGVVKRKVKIKDGNRATVDVVGAATLPNDIVAAGISITTTVQTDLCGIDIGEREDGSFFFIEYNTSPQFEGFERETSQNIAEKVCRAL